MVSFSMTLSDPNLGFKVTVYLQVYLKNDTSYGQSYYRTLIGNHTQSIEWYLFLTLTDPRPEFQSRDIFRHSYPVTQKRQDKEP